MPLDELVLFVRAGAILCLQAQAAGAAPIQYSDQMGGALAVQVSRAVPRRPPHTYTRLRPSRRSQVYAGRNGAFTLVEDDGETLNYAGGGAAATRRTAWAWDDVTRTLTWTVSGGFTAGPNLFTTASVMLFVANATSPVTQGPVTLGYSGSLKF